MQGLQATWQALQENAEKVVVRVLAGQASSLLSQARAAWFPKESLQPQGYFTVQYSVYRGYGLGFPRSGAQGCRSLTFFKPLILEPGCLLQARAAAWLPELPPRASAAVSPYIAEILTFLEASSCFL